MWVNDMWAQCICDTLTWLPTKIPMPSTTSMDHILAGIAEIALALKKPSPNLPLALLTDSQSTALHTLMIVLHNTVLPSAIPAMPHKLLTAQATPLRVPPTSETTLPTPATPVPHYIPLDDDSPAALRVPPEPITLLVPAPPSGLVLIPPDHDDATAPTSNCSQHHAP